MDTQGEQTPTSRLRQRNDLVLQRCARGRRNPRRVFLGPYPRGPSPSHPQQRPHLSPPSLRTLRHLPAKPGEPPRWKTHHAHPYHPPTPVDPDTGLSDRTVLRARVPKERRHGAGKGRWLRPRGAAEVGQAPRQRTGEPEGAGAGAGGPWLHVAPRGSSGGGDGLELNDDVIMCEK